ncbi:hypothetical protein GUITHDRAFT_106742 [Guillardia theta CCMP2712]|uniref:Uncharacterized protein n=1 Tax=Guillardia theta (strain CCMP2712) TaxID=905079 RepID=L1JG66_GUITC|nr:hypothetical protein GUITHDRAFT_106742 [Guillardia theta CCMP2712]EKX47292.1 hypothetical protein GUITHDRAFT_106742 [Guillardia theta CCMP2712]|eukprot:XP_005834272.1 hypothetical protein GUITHDRAFT_106742 [Guillardia theta CCMP2712]
MDEHNNNIMARDHLHNYMSPEYRTSAYQNSQNNILARLSRVRHERTFRSDIDHVLARSPYSGVADDLSAMNMRDSNSFPGHRYGNGYGYGSGFSAPAMPPPDSSEDDLAAQDLDANPFGEDENYELESDDSAESIEFQDSSFRSFEHPRDRDGAGSLDFPIITSGRSIDSHVLRNSPELQEEFTRGRRDVHMVLPSRAYEAVSLPGPNVSAHNLDGLGSFSGNQDAVTITLQTVAGGQMVQVSTTLRGEELAKRVARRTCELLRACGIAVNSDRIESNDTLALAESNTPELILSDFEERTAMRLAERVRSSLHSRYASRVPAEENEEDEDDGDDRWRDAAIVHDDRMWRADRGFETDHHDVRRSLSPNKDVGSMFRKKSEPLLTWQDRRDHPAIKFGLPHRSF